MTERQLQVEIEVEFFRAGSKRTAYGSLVGSGPNASVLHFAPGGRALRDGDLVLVDAGAEWNGYASDVTRTFPVAPRYEGIQRDLYALVLDVQQRAIAGVGQERIQASTCGPAHRRQAGRPAHPSRRPAVGLSTAMSTRSSSPTVSATCSAFPPDAGGSWPAVRAATVSGGGCAASLEPGAIVTVSRHLTSSVPATGPPVRAFRDAVDWGVDTCSTSAASHRDDVLVTQPAPTCSRGHPRSLYEIPEALSA
jgi:hypothetical protein